MPSVRKDRGNGWWARAIVNGRQVACRMFPPGKKGGPEWRAAKEWEEKTAAEFRKNESGRQTLTGWQRLLVWGEMYLDHVERTMRRQTLVEKETVMKAFFAFCNRQGIDSPEALTRPLAYQFLADIADERGNNRANVYRKNLLAAWNWGIGCVPDFPQTICVLERIRPFPVKRNPRYVPPEEDVIKVLQQTQGQDLVFLLCMYFTGARRGELFRLRWEDVDLQMGRIRLVDYKGGDGAERQRFLAMHPELIKALAWWFDARPCKTDNVFMQTQSHSCMGLPYTQRVHFMNNLCDKAGVRRFGFHSLRHKSAAITFVSEGLSAAQVLMGHYRATTTDNYVRSAGLYMDQETIMDALGNNGIGRAVTGLFETETPQGITAPEAFCTQEHVHNMLH